MKNYIKVFFILLISMTPGWYICDILGHPLLGVITTGILCILLMFPFGFLKIERIKRS